MTISSRLKQTVILNLAWLLFFGACSGTSLDATALLGGTSQISDDDALEGEISESDQIEAIAEDGLLVDVSDETALGTESEVSLDDSATAESGTESIAGSTATAEAEGESETDLHDLTVASLPVTIAKEDEDSGADSDTTSGLEECSAEEYQTISLSYTEGNVTRRMSGLDALSPSPFVRKLISGILSESSASADEEGDQIIFLLPQSINLKDSGDDEFTVETCTVQLDENEDGDTIYQWVTLESQDLAGLELETGRVRVNAGRVSVNNEGTVLGFTGMASRFRLSAEDFGADDVKATPFVILR